MTGNIFGERFLIVSFGESHGYGVGIVLDGCPAGLPLNESDIQKELDLRRPGVSLVSSLRHETDRVRILSGVFKGMTTGAPICTLIENKDIDSSAYEKLLDTPRPGHADYVARIKYGNLNDYRGGGRFSARVTAGYVMAGAIAKKLLARTLGIEVLAYSLEIGGIRSRALTHGEIRESRYSNEVRCPDRVAANKMKKRTLDERRNGDSVGGIVECITLNAPVGMGEPVFGSLEGEIGKAIFSIPAVKGIEFGSGFACARLKGSENNDGLRIGADGITFGSNNSGGILGGISNSMPIVFRTVFKPVSSIPKPQKTVNLVKMEESEVTVTGRHDSCVVPRAVPIVENMMATVLADHALRAGMISPVLK
tara:strand:- start:1507 stop:2604 length:1098 start_codon:yes stop_codon:yes gene_type:complete